MKSLARTVLVVDDEEDFPITTAMILEGEGYRVHTVAGGIEALAFARTGSPVDVVMLDQRMPGLPGTETLRLLREAGLAAPAILVSAMADLEATADRNGFAAALPKPFEIRALLAVIQRLTDGRAAP